MLRFRFAPQAVTLGLLSLVTPTVLSAAPQQSQTPPASGQTTAAAPQTPPAPDQDVSYKETVVVSASKTEQQLVDAPATMTVIGQRSLAVAQTSNYADLLRNVPGLNITQISARDVNVTSRGATSSLATSQLAVLDGRSLYQDFFGFVMWDFMPANLDEIKRIEVIRGPASAVWGANALNGVVNVITKSPREAPGTWFTVGAGSFNRDVNDVHQDAGTVFYSRATTSQVVNERWSYKLSGGLSTSDALARPNGNIPNGQSRPTPYPAYANTGTTQPKFDTRVDYDFPDQSRKLQMSGGIGATDGVMHTGIGPFDIDRGARMGYAKVNYLKNAFKFQAFVNTLHGDATNLVSVGTDGKPIALSFDTQTYDFEVGDTKLVQTKHVFTYGGNLRFNHFDLTIAPAEHNRTEGGAYVQDEFLISKMYRIVAGARLDKFSSIDNAVFSPRVAFVFKPVDDQSIRVSYNRAFRAPSMVNNNLNTTLATALPLGAINPGYGNQIYYVPTTAVGNPDLTEEHIDAYEVAYTGNIRNRASVSAAFYYTNFSQEIFFTQTGTWTAAPPGFPGLGPFPPNAIWGAFLQATGLSFPSNYTYKNLGEVKSKGIELGIDGTLTRELTGFVNYAYQADPIPAFPGLTPEQARNEINLPARHLFNMGVTCMMPRWFGTVGVSHSSDAFWQDVLDDRYHGTTQPFTIVNLTLGTKFQGGRYTASLKVTNLANQQVQQHVFGDMVKRQVMGEFKIRLDK